MLCPVTQLLLGRYKIERNTKANDIIRVTFLCMRGKYKISSVQRNAKHLYVSSYIAPYPILKIAQSALHFTSLADMFNQC